MAIECYDKVIELESKEFNFSDYTLVALIKKGISIAELQMYEEAIELYDKAIEFDHDGKYRKRTVEAWTEKGIALEMLGRLEKAYDCYEAAIMQDPYGLNPYATGEAYKRKGSLLANKEMHKEAIECFAKAIKIFSWHQIYGCAQALLLRGISFDAMGRFHESILCYDKAIEKFSRF